MYIYKKFDTTIIFLKNRPRIKSVWFLPYLIYSIKKKKGQLQNQTYFRIWELTHLKIYIFKLIKHLWITKVHTWKKKKERERERDVQVYGFSKYFHIYIGIWNFCFALHWVRVRHALLYLFKWMKIYFG